MRRILRHRPSPALVVACLALTIALGGTSYAAVTLPRNSVGTPQLKRNAVNSAKVKNFSLLRVDFKRGQVPAGPRGLQGLQGLQGLKGDKGDKGDPGQDLTVTQPLQPGQTETGTFHATGNAAGYSAYSIDFRPNLPADIADANAHYVTGASAANCPGQGQADPGHLCVYQSASVTSTFLGFFKISSAGGTGVEKEGVLLFWSVTASQSRVWGTWAVRAS